MRHLLLAMGLLLAGCETPLLMQYLESAEGRATQEEVRSRYGAPVKEITREDGGVMWTYHHRSYQPDPPFAVSSCTEYRLSFDSQHILRTWSEQPC